MITGFNTDIVYEGVTYHVQTEDKGLATPLILSLVYDRGTILASKRSPYDDLLAGEFDEQVLVERLQKQHKLICAAVRAGRIEDLKRMTMKESALRQKSLVAQKEVKPIVEEQAPTPIPGSQNGDVPPPSLLQEKFQTIETPIGRDVAAPDAHYVAAPVVIEKPTAETVELVEEEMILPAEAVEILSEFVNAEPVNDDKIRIQLIGETNALYKGGERLTLTMIIRRSNESKGISGAHVLVKIIGSTFRPLIFHARTDSNGVATVHLQLPHFRAGRAGILIKAMSEGEQTELRRVVVPG